MSEKDKNYPELVLFEDGSYEVYEKDGVQLKFKYGRLLKEFIDNPDLNIIVVGFPEGLFI